MTKDLTKITENVKLMLFKYPEFRRVELRKSATWNYWTQFEGLTAPMHKSDFLKLTSAETISRCIRKVQEQNPALQSDNEIKKYEEAEQFRLHFGGKNDRSKVD